MNLRSNKTAVAQVGNLLFRRLAVGAAPDRADRCGLPIRDTADYQSARRFFRLTRELMRQ